ncbi:MAG TPA: redoxin family protein [Acidobacteriaceae bacterium]
MLARMKCVFAALRRPTHHRFSPHQAPSQPLSRQRTPTAPRLPWLLLLAVPLAAPAQSQPQHFTDPLPLLAAVAQTYAAGADTFDLASTSEMVRNGELEHDWQKVYRHAIKGPGKQYRIETRSAPGSFVQVSDGTSEWVYLVEANVYLRRPLPQNWPQFQRVMNGGSQEVQQAWQMRTWLEATVTHFRHATLLPPETLTIEGRSYPCYVVHVTSDDSTLRPQKDYHYDRTLWIDTRDLVLRKQVEHTDTALLLTATIHIPAHHDVTTLYPLADFHPLTTPKTFTFVPPAGSTQVVSMEPEWATPPAAPSAQKLGTMAPEVSLLSADGARVALSSYRGRPVLLDVWATWCGACLVSMPALARLHDLAATLPLAILTVDEDEIPSDATAYLARHGYRWTNVHDPEGTLLKAFASRGIPLTVLLDAQGKIAYYDFAGDEAAVRQAIASLGPPYRAALGP